MRINIAGAAFRDGKILLCQRASTKKVKPNLWHIPGGAVDEGETILEAVTREFEEEMQVKITKLVKISEIEWEYIHGGVPAKTIFVKVEFDGQIILNFENQAYKWVSFDELGDFIELETLSLNQQIFKDLI